MKDDENTYPTSNKEWETIIDFTEIQKGGIPVQDILQAMSAGRLTTDNH